MLRLLNLISIFAISVLLIGCSTSPKKNVTEWIPDKNWWEQSSSSIRNLQSTTGRVYFISGDQIKNYYEISNKLMNISGISAVLVITDSKGINAFAIQKNHLNYIGITIEMLQTFGSDKDAMASVIGHELAHLKLDHQKQRSNRKKIADTSSNILGAVAGYFVPFGGTITSIGATAIVTSYSREEEREADVQGMIWAVEAGYSPCGFVRWGKHVEKNESAFSIPFLQTHPMTKERVNTANQLAISKNLQPCIN